MREDAWFAPASTFSLVSQDHTWGGFAIRFRDFEIAPRRLPLATATIVNALVHATSQISIAELDALGEAAGRAWDNRVSGAEVKFILGTQPDVLGHAVSRISQAGGLHGVGGREAEFSRQSD